MFSLFAIMGINCAVKYVCHWNNNHLGAGLLHSWLRAYVKQLQVHTFSDVFAHASLLRCFCSGVFAQASLLKRLFKAHLLRRLCSSIFAQIPLLNHHCSGTFAQASLLGCLCSGAFAQVPVLSCLCSGVPADKANQMNYLNLLQILTSAVW